MMKLKHDDVDENERQRRNLLLLHLRDLIDETSERREGDWV